jgi:hypothetical protein
MSRRASTLFSACFALIAVAPAAADDLRGADRLICAASMILACGENGECYEVQPADLNVPQFIEIDLASKRLSTTKASGQNRSTPILTLKRENGTIVLQGYEGGRAFSFIISEEDGRSSAAVARDGLSVAVFGACTPSPAGR